ncbi:MAG: cytochrome c [Gammaproteobacteria bacterium]|nr:cytochrome c [Gammaproteobacteria bacterium]
MAVPRDPLAAVPGLLAVARSTAAGMALVLTVAGCAVAPVDTSAGDEDSLVGLGRTVFLERAEPGCALCHTLADAGAAGAVGPDLDALRPGLETVVSAVRDGVGVMPPQAGLLTEAEIRAVARYVVHATGGG